MRFQMYGTNTIFELTQINWIYKNDTVKFIYNYKEFNSYSQIYKLP